MLAGEPVHVLNLNNGRRFVTYTISAAAGSRTVMLNGPAARVEKVGDKVMVLSYGQYIDEEAKGLKPIPTMSCRVDTHLAYRWRRIILA